MDNKHGSLMIYLFFIDPTKKWATINSQYLSRNFIFRSANDNKSVFMDTHVDIKIRQL